MFQNKTIHFIGIGGISMSGIAMIAKSLGAKVTGSDITESELTENLKKEGMIINYGHHAEMIENADIVVYTAAIHEDDPERIETKKLNKENYERAEFLGIISKEYQNCLCISGTHGKSTTTGMVSLIFLEAKLNPTIQIGAMLSQINGNTYIGDNNYLIMESCEYVDSFLHFHPTGIIITNIDNDHLDYFKNLDNIKKSFNKYVNLLPENGILVKNNDDTNSNNVESGYEGKIITYGIKNNSDYMAKNISKNDLGHYSFDIYYHDELLTTINLNINGYHNIYNTLAAFALSYNYIKDINTIKNGLEKYRGVGRRFEYLGTYNGAYIYDDYAHHPTEIKTTLTSVKEVKHNKDYCIFQSHTYSRTKEHLDAFADVLSKFDNIIIAPIYPAREINTFNISEDMLVDKIKGKNPNVIYLDSFAKITDYIKNNVQEKDLVITVGAGPVNKISQDLVKEN
ncbi:MAG TPA: UDP-N-acetylmuramate--L-alanine ligase [Candidatus Onthocola stercoravium]|nr:UDP-N-acetylmuramate--L-alanine ligase [Candidatus Onthocola stercoravium]